MMKLINKLLGTRYWYQVRFIYKTQNGDRIFDVVWEVGLSKRSTVLNYRAIKKSFPPLHKIPIIPKNLLMNGKLNIEIVCYLGWIKKNKIL